MKQPNDEHWMRRALEHSRRGRGHTSPRPSVGCVLVQDNREIGGAHTQPGDGNPHAEIMAMKLAREAEHELSGATAYVTLEPCSHFGTTPPCADALIDARIARVVCGVGDPDVRVAGRGFAKLRAAGIEVETGILVRDCFRAQDAFLISVVRQNPFVSLKLALSLDGKIALPNGQSQWITGETARQFAHELRFEHDAIAVGVNTILADNPRLTVRGVEKTKAPGRELKRVVFDSQGRIPLASTCVQTAREIPTFVLTTSAMSREKRRDLENCGVQVLAGERDEANRVDLNWALQTLWELGVQSLMIEGGAALAGAAMRAGIIDRVDCFLAPKFLGDGHNALQGFAIETLADAPQLQQRQIEILGEDVLISGYLHSY